MFVHYRTQGFILKKEDRGEADQLFTIYTKDFGKLEILGKAIRKISSKLRSGMEIFYLSEIEFIQGKTYKTLTDTILIEKFQNLRSDLERLDIAYKIARDIDNFVKGEEPDEKIWHLLSEVFHKLNNCQIVKLSNCQLLYYFFFWNFISILGYKPELYFCPSCQKKLKPEKLYFSAKEGGIICQDCSKKIKDRVSIYRSKRLTSFPSSLLLHKSLLNEGEEENKVLFAHKIEIKPEAVKILRKILEKDWKILSKLKNIEEYLRALEFISQNYSPFIYRASEGSEGEEEDEVLFDLERRNDKI